jgi:hypothetical protein
MGRAATTRDAGRPPREPMARFAPASVFLALSLGCAMGEMPQAAPADGGLDEADDEGTPLTTGADDGGDDDAGGAEGDDAADAAGSEAGEDDATATGGEDGVDTSEGGGDTQAVDDAADDAADDGGEGSTGSADTGDTGGDADAGDTEGGDDGPLPDAIDVSDYELVQTDAFRVITLPPGTVVPPGAYLVIGRDATRVQFEAFWGALPADAVYVDGATLDPDTFPTINGDESYELLDASGAGVDGPSAPLALLGNLQRVDPGEPATLAASWASSIDANTDATPGAGQVDSALFSGIYISEVSDTAGSGNFVYEFVELYHDP